MESADIAELDLEQFQTRAVIFIHYEYAGVLLFSNNSGAPLIIILDLNVIKKVLETIRL